MPTRRQVEEQLLGRGYEPAETEGFGGTYTETATRTTISLGTSIPFRHPRETERGAVYLHGEADAVMVPNGPYLRKLRAKGIDESGTSERGERIEPAWRGDALTRALQVL